MNLRQNANRTTLGQKLALGWLLLFTIGAGVSQFLVYLGYQLKATPEIAYLPPFQTAEHILGTDQLGRDVFLYLLLGCRTSWLLTIPPLLVATLIGLILGTSAAIWGNNDLRIPVYKVFIAVGVLAGCIYLYPKYQWWMQDKPFYANFFGVLILSAVVLFMGWLASSSGKMPNRRSVSLPLDEILQKTIGIWSSFPKLLLLLLLTTLSPFSLFSLMTWICATFWVLPARVARSMVQHLKNESYFETAQTLGIPFWRVFTSFLWPSLKAPVLTNFCFAASGLLGISSTLAYLGIGLPADVPTWGKMLSGARYSVEAWWLILFPSLVLLLSIFSLQVLGNRISTRNTSTNVTS